MDLFGKFAPKDDNLGRLRHMGASPFFQPVERRDGAWVWIRGKPLVNLATNDYLGLTQHPQVREAACRAIQTHGTSCSGSRPMNGTLPQHLDLEQQLAEFLNMPAALIFPSGFSLHGSTLPVLVNEGDWLFCHRQSHASILDGLRLTDSEHRFFTNHVYLESLLQLAPDTAGKLIVTDGVFSMSGEVPNLAGLLALGRSHDARIYVDDAHGIGVLGPGGRGTAAAQNQSVDLLMGTLAKAFASQGGFICGPKLVIDALRRHGRAFIFSTALSPAHTAAATQALHILKQNPDLPASVLKNAHDFHSILKQLNLETTASQSTIVPWIIGNELLTFVICGLLRDMGFFVAPAVFPAVPQGRALLRFSISAPVTRNALDRLGIALHLLKKTMDTEVSPGDLHSAPHDLESRAAFNTGVTLYRRLKKTMQRTTEGRRLMKNWS